MLPCHCQREPRLVGDPLRLILIHTLRKLSEQGGTANLLLMSHSWILTLQYPENAFGTYNIKTTATTTATVSRCSQLITHFCDFIFQMYSEISQGIYQGEQRRWWNRVLEKDWKEIHNFECGHHFVSQSWSTGCGMKLHEVRLEWLTWRWNEPWKFAKASFDGQH